MSSVRRCFEFSLPLLLSAAVVCDAVLLVPIASSPDFGVVEHLHDAFNSSNSVAQQRQPQTARLDDDDNARHASAPNAMVASKLLPCVKRRAKKQQNGVVDDAKAIMSSKNVGCARAQAELNNKPGASPAPALPSSSYLTRQRLLLVLSSLRKKTTTTSAKHDEEGQQLRKKASTKKKKQKGHRTGLFGGGATTPTVDNVVGITPGTAWVFMQQRNQQQQQQQQPRLNENIERDEKTSAAYPVPASPSPSPLTTPTTFGAARRRTTLSHPLNSIPILPSLLREVLDVLLRNVTRELLPIRHSIVATPGTLIAIATAATAPPVSSYAVAGGGGVGAPTHKEYARRPAPQPLPFVKQRAQGTLRRRARRSLVSSDPVVDYEFSENDGGGGEGDDVGGRGGGGGNGEQRFQRTYPTQLIEESANAYDPKCNSERLRSIIQEATGRDLASVKRNIQELAESRLGRFLGHFNVICADDDFSYITNTEEFCQDVVASGGGKIACFVFSKYKRRELEKGSGAVRRQTRPPSPPSPTRHRTPPPPQEKISLERALEFETDESRGSGGANARRRRIIAASESNETTTKRRARRRQRAASVQHKSRRRHK